jgi:hypothetical protein
MMVTWLTRSLLFIVVGAVLAYAVTAHVDPIDLQTAGLIILLVGIFDLLLNVALTLYYRHIPSHPSPAPRRDYDDEVRDTRPIPRYRDPDWH